MQRRIMNLKTSPETQLCQAIWAGDVNVVNEMLQTSPETFFAHTTAPVTCFKSRVFGPGTTPLEVLFYTLDPMMEDVLDRLSRVGFKERIDARRKAYSFTGLMTSVNNEPMRQENFYSFAPLSLNLSGRRIVRDFHRDLGNMPGWASCLICHGDISGTNNLADSFKRRVKKPYFTYHHSVHDSGPYSSILYWDEFLTNKKYCGLIWENISSSFLPNRDPILEAEKKNLDDTARTFERLTQLHFHRRENFSLETLNIRTKSLVAAEDVGMEFKRRNDVLLNPSVAPRNLSTPAIIATLGITHPSQILPEQKAEEEIKAEKPLADRALEAFAVSDVVGSDFIDSLEVADAIQLLKEMCKKSCSSSPPPPYEPDEQIYRLPSPVG